MSALAKELSSFVQPLSTYPNPAVAPLSFRIAMPLVILLSSTLPLKFFWDAYDAYGAMPWDHGFLSYPVAAAVPLPSHGELTLGLAWMFALLPAFFLGYTILLTMLGRRGRTLSAAGAMAVLLIGIAPFAIAMERTTGNIRAMGSTLGATFAEISHAKSVLKAKGLDEEAKALDERLVRLMPPMPDRR